MNIKDTQTGSPEGVYTPEPRVYELGYLIMPTVNEGDLSNERDALVALITKFKGIVISEGQPVLIDLAYEMDKIINNKRQNFNQSYFGWIKFDITPDLVEALTAEIESVDSLIRFILVKTVRGNTITSDSPFKLARTNASADEDQDTDLTDNEGEDEVTEEVSSETPAPAASESDDLTKIEGIGPKIAELLVANGIATFADLSGSKVGDLRTLLADNDLSQHEPKSWSKQATLAKNDKWDELEKLQAELDGGRE